MTKYFKGSGQIGRKEEFIAEVSDVAASHFKKDSDTHEMVAYRAAAIEAINAFLLKEEAGYDFVGVNEVQEIPPETHDYEHPQNSIHTVYVWKRPIPNRA